MKDFTCPGNILLKEMPYFRDYLSLDSRKWKNIDISVHCDVKIFDWLICYIKKKKDSKKPKLGMFEVYNCTCRV